MKKLFFILSFFAATTLVNQAVKPMQLPQPPQEFFIEPRFECTFITSYKSFNTIIYEYKIQGLNNKFRPTINPDPLSLAFITLIFTNNESKTGIGCHIRTVTATATTNYNYENSMISTEQHIESDVEFPFLESTEEFKKLICPAGIIHFVEIAISFYFRHRLLNFKKCMLCLHEIKAQEPAILLQCGSGTHEECYNKKSEAAYQSRNKNVSEDVWCKLEALHGRVE